MNPLSAIGEAFSSLFGRLVCYFLAIYVGMCSGALAAGQSLPEPLAAVAGGSIVPLFFVSFIALAPILAGLMVVNFVVLVISLHSESNNTAAGALGFLAVVWTAATFWMLH